MLFDVASYFVAGIIGMMAVFDEEVWSRKLAETYDDYFNLAMKCGFARTMECKYRVLFCELFLRELTFITSENTFLSDYERFISDSLSSSIFHIIGLYKKVIKLFKFLVPNTTCLDSNNEDKSFSIIFMQLKMYCLLVLDLSSDDSDKLAYVIMASRYKDIYLDKRLKDFEIFAISFQNYDQFINTVILENVPSTDMRRDVLVWLKNFKIEPADIELRKKIDENLDQMFHINQLIVILKEILVSVGSTQAKLQKMQIPISRISVHCRNFTRRIFGYDQDVAAYIVRCLIWTFFKVNEQGLVEGAYYRDETLLLFCR